MGRALERARPLAGGRMLASVLTQEDFDAAGGDDTEGIVEVMRGVRGVQAAALVREAGPAGSYRVSLRASDPAVDVAQIAGEEGGGGHRAAAGFSTRRARRTTCSPGSRAASPRGSTATAARAEMAVVDPARPSGWWTSPPGPPRTTSWPVVRRRLGRGVKVGHCGTLDPFATGLLVVVVGRATRLAPLLTPLEKTYLATLRTGFTSVTGDPEGPIAESGRPATASEVEELLPGFLGSQAQRVPAYAAVRVDGERLHRRARRGEVVEAPERGSRSPTCASCATWATARWRSRSDAGPAPTCGSSRGHRRAPGHGRLLRRPPAHRRGAAVGGGRRAAGRGRSKRGPDRPLAALAHLPVRELSPHEVAGVAQRPPAPGEGERGRPVALAARGRLVAVARADGAGELRPAVVLEDPR